MKGGGYVVQNVEIFGELRIVAQIVLYGAVTFQSVAVAGEHRPAGGAAVKAL